MFFALSSYSSGDSAFSVSNANPITNQMGPVGAYFADVVFLLFGYSAFLLPALTLLGGLFLLRSDGVSEDRNTLMQRGFGFVLAVVTSSGLATLHFAAGELSETAGGILGQAIGLSLAQLFGLVGATVLLLVVWLGSVSLATGISWITVMDRTGRAALGAATYVNVAVNRARDWFEGRRAKQHRQELVMRSRSKPKLELRIEPTVEKVEVSSRIERERQVPLFEPPASSELPTLALLDDPPQRVGGYSAEALEAMSRLVEMKLTISGSKVEVVAVHPGPVVTRFELKPAPG